MMAVKTTSKIILRKKKIPWVVPIARDGPPVLLLDEKTGQKYPVQDQPNGLRLGPPFTDSKT